MKKKKIRAILLEDNEGVRSLITTLLESRGYEIFAFASPAVCPLLKQPACRCDADSRCADILISDLAMPFVTGIQFLKNQKAKHCKTPYIAMMSGNWKKDEASQASELGCKVFDKPFSISEMEAWLDYIEKNIDLKRELSDAIFENSAGI